MAAEGVEERSLDRGGNVGGELPVDSHHMLASRNHPRLYRCRTRGVEHNSLCGEAVFAYDFEELFSAGILPDDPQEEWLSPESPDILSHICRTAKPHMFCLDIDHGY